MNLKKLLQKTFTKNFSKKKLENNFFKKIIGNDEKNISTIVFDSRKIIRDCVFVAVRGTQSDGHQFIGDAIERGATVIVCEMLPKNLSENIAYIQTENSAEALGLLCAAYYDNPTQNMKVVGVTGTNGKTTTATLLYDLFTGLGYKCGLVSTVEYRVAGKILPSTHTTPDPLSLQKLFADMRNAGCAFAFMEVSSHALEQNRVAGVHFAGAVFTNLTHDHLDYHKTFDNYLKAKRKLFDGLDKSAFAITNNDDRNGQIMIQNTKARRISYALKKMATYRAKILENGLEGLHLTFDGADFHARMIGEFNAYNLLAVFAAAMELLPTSKDEILIVLSSLKGAEGRFDYTYNVEKKITSIVDYAHTPDALEKILETIRQLRRSGQRIITLTGAGGDRDPAKRESMGRISAALSDVLILTSDNPRTENPNTIIEQMKSGIQKPDASKVLEITDRRVAIRTAVQLAAPGDIILLAGKGHEKYQDINGVKHPFDDKVEIEKAMMGNSPN